MKFLLKLLKDWTHGKDTFKAGQTIELEDKAIAGELLADGIAERAEAVTVKTVEQVEDLVTKSVESTIQKIVKDEKVVDGIAAKVHEISVKDLSDDDPSHGYLPAHLTGRKHTKEEMIYGMGLFAADVYAAGPNFANMPERLRKSHERSEAVIRKGYAEGMIHKTADTGGLQAQVNSDVGALIPPEFSTMLLDVAAETAVIRPRCSTISIGSQTINLPKVKDYDRSSGLIHGGVLAYWTKEDADATASKPKLENVKLELNKLTVLAFASHEAMKFSSVALGSYLLPKMADGITFREEDAFVNGAGSGMPQGLLKAGCLVSVTIESGQTLAATAIVTKNIDKMKSRLRVVRPSSCVWLYNKADSYVWLTDLSRTVGAAGYGAFLFKEGALGAGQDTLSGIPAFNCPHCAALGTVGDIILTDLSQYVIADDRAGVETAQSMHLKFDSAQEAFRLIKYVDGQTINSAAFTGPKATATESSILTIAART